MALQETETALSGYSHEIDRHQALVAARYEVQRAANVVLARQREGTTDFLTVLDAQRTLADAQADLAASDARIAFSQADLFPRAGWRLAADAAGGSGEGGDAGVLTGMFPREDEKACLRRTALSGDRVSHLPPPSAFV